ncbi:uncharacterized protein [Amphiura filiformis]|uniref:uncharacterized protein isoform X2 n=1 Tax=Amphiura filiformis TaxID=82378 RepID=UPI003B20D8E9
MAKYESFIQTVCVFVIAVVTLSNAFVLLKKPAKLIDDIQKTDRAKRDGDNINDSLSASLTSGSVNMQGSNLDMVEDQELEENECRLISEVEVNQFGLPIGEPLDSSEISNMTDTRRQQYRRQRYHSYDSSTGQCPESLLDTSGHHSVSRNSLCPWTYVSDTDEDRHPREMMFAECHCPHCIDSSSQEYVTIGSSCKPIFHKVRVLRKCEGSCVDGICRYKPDYEFVPVACTCVRQRTV